MAYPSLSAVAKAVAGSHTSGFLFFRLNGTGGPHGGGHLQRVHVDPGELAGQKRNEELLALEEALQKLAQKEARAAKLVELRYFAGLTLKEAAEVLGVSLGTTKKDWT